MSEPKYRILIVDDEPLILEMCVEFLTLEGYSVDTVRDARDALSLLDQNTYDVILSDMKMPFMSGARFHELIRERHPELIERMVFITGDVLNTETKTFLENIKNHCLTKPFSLKELREAVKNIIKMP